MPEANSLQFSVWGQNGIGAESVPHIDFGYFVPYALGRFFKMSALSFCLVEGSDFFRFHT
jgi:hypothetical protein